MTIHLKHLGTVKIKLNGWVSKIVASVNCYVCMKIKGFDLRRGFGEGFYFHPIRVEFKPSSK